MWYHMFIHEIDIPPELSCIALRRNSAKANSGAVLRFVLLLLQCISDFHME